jgi:hypothetical protein
LIEAAMELRSHNPAGWDQFVGAVGEYAAQVLALTMSADPALVLRAQGMAVQAGEIAKILREAPQLYAAMQAQKQRAPNHARPATTTPWVP